MSKKYFILGNFLGKDIVGLTRQGYEYLLQIDRFANEFDIELLVPNGYRKYASEIKNMNIVERGEAASKWTATVATRYAKETGRTLINLTFPFSLAKHSIVQIADVRYLEKYNGHYFDSFKFRMQMWLKAYLGSRHADYIMTVSHFSKDRIAKLLHVREDKILVIPNGWEHIARTDADYGIFEKYPQLLQKRFFFTLGSLARHKNHKFIIQLAENNPADCFVIGGGVDPQIFYDDCAVVGAENVIFTGRLSDGEIKALYEKCAAFVFPSLYEGFGIPPLEALVCGTQAIVSDIPVLREIFKNAVHYVNPEDTKVNLNELLEEPVDSPESIMKEYSWEEVGRKWHEFFLKESEK